jgi:hypothetical protein
MSTITKIDSGVRLSRQSHTKMENDHFSGVRLVQAIPCLDTFGHVRFEQE